VDGIYKAGFIISLALGVVYVVRGRRRGDGPQKILDDSLPVGVSLFFSLAHLGARAHAVGFAGLILVVLRMGWNIVRSTRRRDTRN
jgi:hypothetical protein